MLELYLYKTINTLFRALKKNIIIQLINYILLIIRIGTANFQFIIQIIGNYLMLSKNK